MDLLSHRGPDEEADDAKPGMTPGTRAAVDDLASTLERIALRTPGGPDRFASAATPPRRSPRLAPPPDDALAPPSDDVLTALLAKAAASPLPTSPNPPRARASPDARPKLVVRYKRENVTPATSPEATPHPNAAGNARERARSPPPPASPTPSRTSSSASTTTKAFVPGTEPSAPPLHPRHRVETVKADRPHPSPARKPRSRRDVRPAPPSSFAAFRDARREELRAMKAEEEPAAAAAAAAASLAAELEAKALVTPTPRREPRPRAMRETTPTRVGLLYSDVMELHAGPAHHFERPARHAAVVEKFQKMGLEARCERVAAREASDAELLTCHTEAHLATVRTTFDASSDVRVQGEGDIYWTEHTERCARTAAGTACEAALAVATGACDRAFAVVRPPGHHADCGRATGFCFYNNAAVAARVALERDAARRVLIQDWDVHHGNGVQDILYEDPRVLYVSLHRYGDGFYPGTGAATEIGAGAGEGFNVNIPWEEKGLGDADYLAAFDLVIDPVAKSFDPDLVIVAAGFDAAEGDPLGGMRVTDQGYALMTERLLRLADGRCAAALEGGYGLTSTANAAAATLSALLGFATPPLSSRKRPRRSTVETLARVVAAHEERWPALTTETHRDAMRAAFAATRVVGKEGETRRGKEAAAIVATTKTPAEATKMEKIEAETFVAAAKVVEVTKALEALGASATVAAVEAHDADAAALSAALSG
jgi:acetoin utilization deacetylase AcuC-like enzyme